MNRPLDNDSAWQDMPSLWSLRPGVTYLNHGSFGPSPTAVVEERLAWIRRCESEPMDFLARHLDQDEYLADARGRLGTFVGASADDLVFVDNATLGMNAVAASIDLAPGDEVRLTDHEYGAVARLWEQKCRRAGARLTVCRLPDPLVDTEEVVNSILAGADERTRLIVVSHVTSPTAAVLPVADICRRARQQGLSVCIDGPHAPAMVPLDIAALDCDYYTASCHKWLCAPFGSGILYAHPRVQDSIRPAIVSWGRTPVGQQPSWRDEFVWAGTRDPSAYLAVPRAIEFLESVGMKAFRRRTHWLAKYARQSITELTGLDALVPDSSDWYASMVSLPASDDWPDDLQDQLWSRHQIEVPVFRFGGRRLLRVSCHLYNMRGDVDRFVAALGEIA